MASFATQRRARATASDGSLLLEKDAALAGKIASWYLLTVNCRVKFGPRALNFEPLNCAKKASKSPAKAAYQTPPKMTSVATTCAKRQPIPKFAQEVYRHLFNPVPVEEEEMSRPRVAYFYDSEIGNYHYGQGHPMKVRPFPSRRALAVRLRALGRPRCAVPGGSLPGREAFFGGCWC